MAKEALEEMSSPKVDETKLRQIIRAAFAGTDDYTEGFQRAVQAILKETGLSGVEARWLVMRLRGDDPVSGE
jgi:hypothetical protein